MTYYVDRVYDRDEARDLIAEHHYIGTWPSVTHAFGLYRDDDNDTLEGVVTFGKPSTSAARRSPAGREFAPYVWELNRLALRNNTPNAATFLIGAAMRELGPAIIVSFADCETAGHHGGVYQASSFIYTGLSAKRTDYHVDGVNLHNMTFCDQWRGRRDEMRAHYGDRLKLVPRPRKHRYVRVVGSKTFKRRATRALRYAASAYPSTNSLPSALRNDNVRRHEARQ